MMRSTATRLLTTHTGSLPRPDTLSRSAHGDQKAALTRTVRDVVSRQVQLGIDIVSDGELSKPNYGTYITERASGLGGTRQEPRYTPDAEDFPDWAAGPMVNMVRTTAPMPSPACVGEIRRIDPYAIARDAANMSAALVAAGAREGFLNAASPGVLTIFIENQYYPSHEAYLEALVPVMRAEYEAVHAAGLMLQIDAPDLLAHHHQFTDLPVEDWKQIVAGHVEAINSATADIPAEAMRLHACWGNDEGPHTHDVPLRDMIALLLRARPTTLCLQAANGRHEHEWRVFEDVALPADKVLAPGVIDTTTNIVEHPELVAERLGRFADVIDPEQLIAGTDCGMATFADYVNIYPSVAWAKLRSLVDGAALASSRLARRGQVR